MDGDTRRVAISRNVGFYESRVSMRAPDGRWVDLPIPETATFDALVSGQAIVTLVEPLGALQPGSVVAFDIAAMLAGQKPRRRWSWRRAKTQAIEEVSATDNVLWIKALDDVSGKLFALSPPAGRQLGARDMTLPANSTIHIVGTADKQDIAFVTVEGMLTADDA